MYSYTLTNDLSSTLNVEGLSFAIASDAGLQSIIGPIGWDIIYFPGDTLVTWESSDISAYFITPGLSETFSFLSRLDSAQQPYLVTVT